MRWEPPRPRPRRGASTIIGWVAVGIGVGIIVLFFAALIVSEIVDEAFGCGSIDPTDAANYSLVTVVNDTDYAVILDDCHGAFCTIDGHTRLRPGERTHVEAACAASGADMTSWRITSASGRPAGFIAVDTPRKHDGLLYRVSTASPDRVTPTQAIDPDRARS